MNKFVLRQAQELQAKLAKAQQELAEMTTEVNSGGGAIKIVVDGQQRIRSVSISTEVINAEDAEMLEDLVMNSITGGLKIPGLF